MRAKHYEDVSDALFYNTQSSGMSAAFGAQSSISHIESVSFYTSFLEHTRRLLPFQSEVGQKKCREMFFRRILKRSSQYNIISLVAAVAEQRGSNEAERRERERESSEGKLVWKYGAGA
jgi:hypothetical protein